MLSLLSFSAGVDSCRSRSQPQSELHHQLDVMNRIFVFVFFVFNQWFYLPLACFLNHKLVCSAAYKCWDSDVSACFGLCAPERCRLKRMITEVGVFLLGGRC